MTVLESHESIIDRLEKAKEDFIKVFEDLFGSDHPITAMADAATTTAVDHGRTFVISTPEPAPEAPIEVPVEPTEPSDDLEPPVTSEVDEAPPES